MTAVEWLEKRFLQTESNLYEEDFVKAKEMEKQHIIKAYNVGYITDFKLNSDYTTQTSEQYYNEKFKMK